MQVQIALESYKSYNLTIIMSQRELFHAYDDEEMVFAHYSNIANAFMARVKDAADLVYIRIARNHRSQIRRDARARPERIYTETAREIKRHM